MAPTFQPSALTTGTEPTLASICLRRSAITSSESPCKGMIHSLSSVHSSFCISASFARQNVANAPYKVNIEENSKMASPFKSYMEGPGLEPGLKVTETGVFTIQAVYPNGQKKTTGGDKFECMITDPNRQSIHPQLVDNNNGTWTVWSDSFPLAPFFMFRASVI